MSKKHWIYIKRGLSEDPKHRAAMGECIWLYMHIIDRADWETGIAYDWKDNQESADMVLPVDTLRRQRQKLDELDYIRCTQKQHSQDIAIMEWRNPREYDSQIRNPRVRIDDNPENNKNDVQGDNQGSNEGLNQVPSGVKTPSFDSKSKTSSMGGLSEKEYEQANAKVTAMIEAQKQFKYQNRDKIPEPYLSFADAYNNLTGQEPTKRVIQDWLMTFSEWQSEGITVEHIREAYKYATRPEGGFLVARPGSLTNTAVAIKTKMKVNYIFNETKLDHTQEVLKEIEEHRKTAVPPPAYVGERLRGLTKKLEVKE